MLQLVAGLSLTVLAWGILVWRAIAFGSQARSGESLAWLFLALATLGAAACLFTTLILGTKVFVLLRGDTPRPPPGSGGHRASR